MKVKVLRRLIRAGLKGVGVKNFSATAKVAQEAQENSLAVLEFGRKHDADAVLIFVKKDNTVDIVLFTGRTILLGLGITEYLIEYRDGVSEHIDNCIEWLVDNATDGLKEETVFQIILKDDASDRWRGFRGDKPMTLDEIKAKTVKH